MKNITITRLDTFLNYFYDNTHYQKIDEIHKNVLPEEPILHTLIILNKMVKDGNITDEGQKTTSRNAVTNQITDEYEQSAYFISYEGILFKELGGYDNYYKREEDRLKSIEIDLILRRRNDHRLVT